MDKKQSEPMNVGGRPTKFTPDRVAKILDAIGNYVPYIIAAEGNGITEATLYQWIIDGKQDLANGIDSDKARFSEAIKKIELDKILLNAKKIEENGERWQSNAWLLERRWPKHFSQHALAIEEIDAKIAKLEKMHEELYGEKNVDSRSNEKQGCAAEKTEGQSG